MSLSRQERAQCDREDRAFAFLLDDPALFWRFVYALDVIGWKIVPQDDRRGDMRLPVPLGSERKNWPNWIMDDRETTASHHVRSCGWSLTMTCRGMDEGGEGRTFYLLAPPARTNSSAAAGTFI